MNKSKFQIERERDEDWERAQYKMVGALKLLTFYVIAFAAGSAFFLTGLVCLIQSRTGWGHSVAILIGGLFLMLLSPAGYRNDTRGLRDDD